MLNEFHCLGNTSNKGLQGNSVAKFSLGFHVKFLQPDLWNVNEYSNLPFLNILIHTAYNQSATK